MYFNMNRTYMTAGAVVMAERTNRGVVLLECRTGSLTMSYWFSVNVTSVLCKCHIGSLESIARAIDCT